MQRKCECPDDASRWWDCTECPIHGEDACAEGAAEHKREIDAENAWLTHSENQFDPDAEEELRRERMDIGLMWMREQRKKWED